MFILFINPVTLYKLLEDIHRIHRQNRQYFFLISRLMGKEMYFGSKQTVLLVKNNSKDTYNFYVTQLSCENEFLKLFSFTQNLNQNLTIFFFTNLTSFPLFLPKSTLVFSNRILFGKNIFLRAQEQTDEQKDN